MTIYLSFSHTVAKIPTKIVGIACVHVFLVKIPAVIICIAYGTATSSAGSPAPPRRQTTTTGTAVTAGTTSTGTTSPQAM